MGCIFKWCASHFSASALGFQDFIKIINYRNIFLFMSCRIRKYKKCQNDRTLPILTKTILWQYNHCVWKALHH